MAAVTLPVLPKSLPFAKLTEALVLRICRTSFADAEPGFRAAQTYRFDDPAGSFGTCYVARDYKTCFLETLVRDRSLIIPRSEYDARSVAALLLDTSKLRLVSIHGDDGVNLGIDQAAVAGADYAYPQALSQLIHNHGEAPDGIVYRSRFDDRSLAVVLFERAKPCVRLFPGSKPIPLPQVHELSDALRTAIGFSIL